MKDRDPKPASGTEPDKPGITWDPAGAKTSRADSVHVSLTRDEVSLLFGTAPSRQAGQGELRGRLTSRIVLNPHSAKRTALLLTDFIGAYEARYGPIETGPPADRRVFQTHRDRSTLPLWEDPDKKALQLIDMVQQLNVPFGFERSFKMSSGTLLDRRFLITFAKGSLGIDGHEAVYRICRELGMSEEFGDTYAARLFKANYCHFGYEEGSTGSLYKAYLEFWSDWEEEITSRPGRTEPFLLHLGFKWDSAVPEKRALTQYVCHPRLGFESISEKVSGIYGDNRDPACETALSIVGMAARRVSPEKVLFLEVTEDESPRVSFDINLYKAGLRMKTIHPLLMDLGGRYNLEEGRLASTLSGTVGKDLGHISGGTGRDGEDFITLYYGVEGH